MTKDKIREIFMKHGFTVKQGEEIEINTHRGMEKLQEVSPSIALLCSIIYGTSYYVLRVKPELCNRKTVIVPKPEKSVMLEGTTYYLRVTDLKAIEQSFDGRIGELFTKIGLVVMNLEEIENG